MDSNISKKHAWGFIEPLGAQDLITNGLFASLEALRREWQRYLDTLEEAERVKIRQRSLRRLSVETGIIERLYDVDWGLTLHLVAEGFSRDVIERAGGKTDEFMLATLVAQRDSLEMVLDFVKERRKLTVAFIKELHAALTRTQKIYQVHDAQGRIFDKPLSHGAWKTQPNHVTLKDGSLFEYTPPEHVAAEMERLVDLYCQLDANPAVHPLIKAAWLHHRFVQIHPFEDGNGRVARALTLLVLEQHKYAPLVVDRFHREDYLNALDAANQGSLGVLTKLFANLESAALTSELERPEEELETGFSKELAHTLAAQLAELKRKKTTNTQKALDARSIAVEARIHNWFQTKEKELHAVFLKEGLKDIWIHVDLSGPKDPKNHWFRSQIIRSARMAGHYAHFGVYTSWCSLRIKIDGLLFRYVASLHGAGRDVGVMAVTTFSEIGNFPSSKNEENDSAIPEYIPTTTDAFRFVHSESTEEISRRYELEELLDNGLAVGLAQLLKQVRG